MTIQLVRLLKQPIKTILVVLTSVIFCSNVDAADLAIGDNIDPIKLQDQFDAPYASHIATTHILFSRSMKGGTIIKEALTSNATIYENPNLIYVADISGMPSLISRFMAMPSFKKYPFRLALDTEGNATQALPAKDDQATLILLDNGTILSIHFFDTKQKLLAKLE